MNNTKVYERILEIGFNNSGENFVFHNFIKELKKEFPDADLDGDPYLMYWFFHHFVGAVSAPDLNFIGRSYNDAKGSNSTRYVGLGQKVYFSADAYYSYIEKIELSEARKASNKAQKSARNAIIIAILTLIVSTAFQIIGSWG